MHVSRAAIARTSFERLGRSRFPDVGVVILHYRHWPVIAGTIECVRNQVAPDRLIVVDNASGDGSADRIAAAFPDIRLHRIERNRGYAAGMNAGAALFRDDPPRNILFLTHECRLAPGTIAALAEALDRSPQAGLIGPMLAWSSAPDRLWSAGGSINRKGRPVHHGQNGPLPRGGDLRRVDWIDGAAMMVRREVFEAVGGLDEAFFLFSEEVDFALRVQALGCNVLVDTGVIVQQEPSGYVPPYLDARNRILLWRRNRRWKHLLASLGVLAVQTALDLPRSGARPKWRRAARLRGIQHGLTERFDPELARLRV